MKSNAAPIKSFHHGNLRQALVEAALASPDIESLSLRQLATEIGVSPAAVYRHFSNREDLLLEVSRIGFDRLAVRFSEAFSLSAPPATQREAKRRLLRLAYAYFAFADEETALWTLMFGSQSVQYRSNPTTGMRANTYEHLAAALHGLRVTGVIQRQPDSSDHLFAWGAIHGVATLRCGQVKSALVPRAKLAAEMSRRVIRTLGGS